MNSFAPSPLRDLAREAVRRLRAAGCTALWAGGCVRDLLLDRAPKDFDIATDAPPERVLSLFPGSVAVGKSFGVVRAPLEGAWFEIATFREDHGYRDGRHPAAVSFTDAPTDAARRDFTINAMFFDPVAERVLDYVGGRDDLARRLVRCVGSPERRFAEDYLRMLRAVRFAATLGFAIEEQTAAAIGRLRHKAAEISAERVREELTRLLTESRRGGDGIRLLDDVGLLAVLLPEVAALKGQTQPPQFHPEGDVFTHTLDMLDRMEHPPPPLAFAALLHDVGKPLTATEQPGDRIRFNGHAETGAVVAAGLLARLRFSGEDAALIAHCVRNHMRFLDVRRMKRATLRRFAGAPTFDLELELHRLDCLASHGGLENYDFLVAFRDALRSEPVLPAPWVTGHDIMALGVVQGPAVGAWRRRAYDAQLENRFPDRDSLLAWLAEEVRRER